jgi:tetratricopeptide (TPR) repeat protein
MWMLVARRRGQAKPRRRRSDRLQHWLIRQLGPLIAAALGAVVSYAAVASSLPDPPSPAQRRWSIIALVGGGIFAFLTAKAGGYALGTRGARPRANDLHQIQGRVDSSIPGMLPRPTPRFVGRTQLLDEIRQRLGLQQPLALTGLAGVGKTQLALAYIGRWDHHYEVVWWIRGEQAATLARDYAALAEKLELPERIHHNQEALIAAVQEWLYEHESWLIVFDNVEDDVELDPYLPRGQHGHVLITTRDRTWQTTAVLEVHPWSREESLEFLRQFGPDDAQSADNLAGALGDFPLALEQAVAYMEETKTSMVDYLALLENRTAELVNLGRPLQYEQPVATTWSVSIERVRKKIPAGEDLLKLCAFLAAEDIPRTLLTNNAKELPRRLHKLVTDRLSYNEAVTALGRYSLVTASSDAVAIHRLVQTVVRHSLGTKEEQYWAGVAVRLLNRAFPDHSDDVTTWSACGRLLPHALVTADNAEHLRVSQESTGSLLSRVGIYLRGRAELQQARLLLRRALAIREAAFGPDHPDVAMSLNNLGHVRYDVGDVTGAKADFERALAIQEAVYGSDNPSVAVSLDKLGLVLHNVGDLHGAKAIYERALHIREKVYGPNHPVVATSLTNLGHVLYDYGQTALARSYLQKALGILEARLRPDHPEVAMSRNKLRAISNGNGSQHRQ